MNSRHFSLISLVFYSFTLFSAPATKFLVTGATKQVDNYGISEYEITVTNPPATNPFIAAHLKGSFGLAGATPVIVQGFCDHPEGRVFKIRYMPSQPGRYDVNLLLSWGKHTYTFKTSLDVTTSDAAGLLQVDLQYPYHFVWSGTGEHYFWNGTTAYLLFGFQDIDIAFAAIDRLHSLGVNHVRSALCARLKDGSVWGEHNIHNSDKFKMQLSPWVTQNPDSIEGANYDTSRFDIVYWQRVEKIIEYARQKGMVMSVIFYLDGARPNAQPFGMGEGGGEAEKNYYHYAINRLAAYSNVIWDISNEYRLLRTDAWAERMGTFVHNNDPYKHLTSIHGFPYFNFRTSPWADFAYYQEWDNAGGYNFMLANRFEQETTKRPIPQVNEEYGYEDHYPAFAFDKICPPGRDGNDRRKLAWRICMAGGYQTTGESAKKGLGAEMSYTGGWINGLGTGESVMLKGNQAMRTIFETTQWWKMLPENDIINHGGYCLANAGEEYLLYVVWGYIKITLVPGKYSVTVYNASDAMVLEKSTFEGGSWEKRFVDWQTDYAIVLKKL